MPASHILGETLSADSTASVRSGPASGRSRTLPPRLCVTLTVELQWDRREEKSGSGGIKKSDFSKIWYARLASDFSLHE